jgi:prostamide/prostaglandin F2alpha synthase
VYIDEKQKTYRDLNYRRFTSISIWGTILSSTSRSAVAEARRHGIRGNFSGNGLQNGGLLIVSKMGTKVLMNHHEEVPGDHVANEDILKVLDM